MRFRKELFGKVGVGLESRGFGCVLVFGRGGGWGGGIGDGSFVWLGEFG